MYAIKDLIMYRIIETDFVHTQMVGIDRKVSLASLSKNVNTICHEIPGYPIEEVRDRGRKCFLPVQTSTAIRSQQVYFPAGVLLCRKEERFFLGDSNNNIYNTKYYSTIGIGWKNLLCMMPCRDIQDKHNHGTERNGYSP